MTSSIAPTRAEFLARRHAGIGGSDAAVVLGKSIYKSPLELWEEKTGRRPSSELDNYHIRRGNRQEPVAFEMFCDKYPGLKTARCHDQLTHALYPWMIGNVDGLCCSGGVFADTVFEIKCPSVRSFRKIQKEGLKEDWIYQGQHYMEVADLDLLIYAVFSAELDELIDFPMERDREIGEMLIDAERTFWNEYVLKNEPPPVDPNRADFIASKDQLRRDDPIFLEAVSRLKTAKELVAEAEALEESAVAEVQELMNNTPGTVVTGPYGQIAWTITKGRASFDKKGLFANGPYVKAVDACALVAEMAPAVSADAIAESVNKKRVDLATFEKPGTPGDMFKATFF